MVGGKLNGPDLSGTVWDGTDLHGQPFDGTVARFPTGHEYGPARRSDTLRRAGLVADHAMLDGASARRAFWQQAVWRSCSASRADFTGARLDGLLADCCHAPRITFADTTLRDCRLYGCGFYHADFTGADLRGADLYACDLTGARLNRIIVDERTQFRCCDLAGADLRGSGLSRRDARLLRCRTDDTLFDH